MGRIAARLARRPAICREEIGDFISDVNAELAPLLPVSSIDALFLAVLIDHAEARH